MLQISSGKTVGHSHLAPADSIDSDGYLVLNNEEYKELILGCIDLYKDCSFVLVSNLPIDKNYFADLPVFYTNGNLIQDLYTLANCNYIVGVSSTYSLWASFYGRVPLCIITSKKQKINRSSFNVYQNLF